jgi:hypothetical protein
MLVAAALVAIAGEVPAERSDGSGKTCHTSPPWSFPQGGELLSDLSRRDQPALVAKAPMLATLTLMSSPRHSSNADLHLPANLLVELTEKSVVRRDCLGG